jgi:hypothetical protein
MLSRVRRLVDGARAACATPPVDVVLPQERPRRRSLLRASAGPHIEYHTVFRRDVLVAYGKVEYFKGHLGFRPQFVRWKRERQRPGAMAKR